jgi:hypothetical protein
LPGSAHSTPREEHSGKEVQSEPTERFGKTVEHHRDGYSYPELERLQDMDEAEEKQRVHELFRRFQTIEDEDERTDQVRGALYEERLRAMQHEHRCYSDDPLFTHPKVVQGLARWLNGSQNALLTQGPQRGLNGIQSLRVAWSWAGVEIAQEERISEKPVTGTKFTVRSLFHRVVRPTFPAMFVGGDVDATNDALKGTLSAKVVAKWRDLPETPADFQVLCQRASSAWRRTGERCLWLEQTQDTFPSGFREAYRYDACEVSSERILALLDSISEEQYEAALSEEGSEIVAKVVVEEDGQPQIELLALVGGIAAVMIRDLEPDTRHVSHWLTATSGGPLFISR